MVLLSPPLNHKEGSSMVHPSSPLNQDDGAKHGAPLSPLKPKKMGDKHGAPPLIP